MNLLSVIIPCYNEESVLEQTHQRLVAVLEGLKDLGFELVYVDDGSTDGTSQILQELLRIDRRVRIIRLSRNFGHQIALSAGLTHASGQAVVTIDADLQDPPEVIADMVRCWRAGFNMAYGVRTDRAGESTFKLWTARAFYALMSRLTHNRIPPEAGDFRLMDRKVVDALLAMPEGDRFMRGLASWVGFKQVGVPYCRAPRAAGTSKYSAAKMLRFAIDAIISFSFAPLRLAIWTGAMMIGLSFLSFTVLFVAWMFRESSPAWWAVLLAGLFCFSGVQLIFLGIIGEYVGRIYNETKRRPLYFIEERFGFEKHNLRAQTDLRKSSIAHK